MGTFHLEGFNVVFIPHIWAIDWEGSMLLLNTQHSKWIVLATNFKAIFHSKSCNNIKLWVKNHSQNSGNSLTCCPSLGKFHNYSTIVIEVEVEAMLDLNVQILHPGINDFRGQEISNISNIQTKFAWFKAWKTTVVGFCGVKKGRFSDGELQLLAEDTGICSSPDTRPLDRLHHPISCNENGHHPIIPRNLWETSCKITGKSWNITEKNWKIFRQKSCDCPLNMWATKKNLVSTIPFVEQGSL